MQTHTQAQARAHRDSLGCTTSDLAIDHALCSGDLVFRRKGAHGTHEGGAATPAEDRGIMVGVSMRDGHRRRMREGMRSADRIFDRDSIYIRGFEANYSATFEGSFDFFLIELPRDFTTAADRWAPGHATVDLTRLQGEPDPVLGALAHSLAPSLARPDQADAIFVEQIGIAIGGHLLRRHGVRPVADDAARPLPLRLVRRAQDLLADVEDEGEKRSIAAVAAELNMSRTQFFRAFRESTGASPYQWLLNQRIERGRRLLRTTDLPLAQVALHCGFADQSHFTRVFSRIEGMSPGRWRTRTR